MKDGDIFLNNLRLRDMIKRREELRQKLEGLLKAQQEYERKVKYIFTCPDLIRMPSYTEYLKEHQN
jgi:hypothetical protein